jgi:hypothetical protein
MPQLTEVSLRELFAEAAVALERELGLSGEVERQLRVADQLIALRFAGRSLADALLPAVSSRLVSQTGARVTVGLWAQSEQPRWGTFDVGPRGLVRGSSPHGVSVVHEAGSGAVTLFDAPRSQILYCVPDIEHIPWWERAAPLRPALFFALAGTSRHLVHAAVVGDAERGGVLLAGPGGSGKTTLALAAVEHGLGYVGDDYVLFENGVAWNLYCTAKVDAGPGVEKLVVQIPSASLLESLPVRAVVVPKIGGGRARLEQITGAEALLALAPSTTFQIPFDRGAVVGTLANLVRRVPCYRLELGERTGAGVGSLEEALERGVDSGATHD